MSNEISYVWGQCTYYVAKSLSWVPAGLGNADEWLANAQKKGFQTTDIPTVGSVVVYGAGNGYNTEFGHVAKVEKVDPVTGNFTVSEMNFKGVNVTDTRVSTKRDVLGFILAPGMKPGKQSQSNGSGGGIPVVGDIAGAIGAFGQGIDNLALTLTFSILAIVIIAIGLMMIAKPVVMSQGPVARVTPMQTRQIGPVA